MSNRGALILDLDDTLYPEASYFSSVFAAFCSNRGWPSSSFELLIKKFRHLRRSQRDLFGFFLDQNRDLWSASDGSERQQYRVSCHSELFQLYTSIQVELKPFEGAATLMEFAHGIGLKVGVITNGVGAAQRNKWSCLDIPWKKHSIFLLASECKRAKPYPDPFDTISHSLGIEINQSIFVGDRFETDLAYPLSRGGVGILLDSDSDSVQWYENWYSSPNLLSVKSIVEEIIGAKDL